MIIVYLIEQYYKDLDLIDELMYEILPYDETLTLFPFNYILLYKNVIIEEGIEYMTSEELSDWSIYSIMDDKIKAKLNLI